MPEGLSLAGLMEKLKENAFSRVPVFAGTLCHATGIVFARDLLHVLDALGIRTVAQLQRPTEFVPETKKVAELLREMQREKQHMRMVIDEYGGVAGLETIEDLLKAIEAPLPTSTTRPRRWMSRCARPMAALWCRGASSYRVCGSCLRSRR